jgi:hypothetical protein
MTQLIQGKHVSSAKATWPSHRGTLSFECAHDAHRQPEGGHEGGHEGGPYMQVGRPQGLRMARPQGLRMARPQGLRMARPQGLRKGRLLGLLRRGGLLAARDRRACGCARGPLRLAPRGRAGKCPRYLWYLWYLWCHWCLCCLWCLWYLWCLQLPATNSWALDATSSTRPQCPARGDPPPGDRHEQLTKPKLTKLTKPKLTKPKLTKSKLTYPRRMRQVAS